MTTAGLLANYDRAKLIVDEQARDPGLWFEAKTAPEACLQQELRRLHAAIEGYTPEQQARIVLDAITSGEFDQ